MKQMVFAGLGIELIGLILASVWLGKELDNHFKTQGIIFVGLLIFVMVGWFVRLLFLLKKLNKDEET